MEEPEKPPLGDFRRSCGGGCIVGPLLLFAVVLIANDSPDFGGIFWLPFFMIFGAIATWMEL